MNSKQNKELVEARMKITKVFMELGNPTTVSADIILSRDILRLGGTTDILELVKANKGVVKDES